jgi:hypothetical protein
VDLAACVTSTNHEAHTSEVELDKPGNLSEGAHAGGWSEVEALRKDIRETEKYYETYRSNTSTWLNRDSRLGGDLEENRGSVVRLYSNFLEIKQGQ